MRFELRWNAGLKDHQLQALGYASLARRFLVMYCKSVVAKQSLPYHFGRQFELCQRSICIPVQFRSSYTVIVRISESLGHMNAYNKFAVLFNHLNDSHPSTLLSAGLLLATAKSTILTIP
jgi:hypothetical protein